MQRQRHFELRLATVQALQAHNTESGEWGKKLRADTAHNTRLHNEKK